MDRADEAQREDAIFNQALRTLGVGAITGPFDRESATRQIFERAAKGRRGCFNLGRGIRALIRRLRIMPGDQREAEAERAARVIHEACPTAPVSVMVDNVSVATQGLAKKAKSLAEMVLLLISAIAFVFGSGVL